MTRRQIFRLLIAAGLWTGGSNSMTATRNLIQRSIPRGGEALPMIGLGTWQTFDVGSGEAARASLREVLREFVSLGGSIIDSSPMYGRSESVVGDLAAELGIHARLFL